MGGRCTEVTVGASGWSDKLSRRWQGSVWDQLGLCGFVGVAVKARLISPREERRDIHLPNMRTRSQRLL